LLRWRLIFGTLFVAALAVLCWLDVRAERPGIFLLPLAIAISLTGAGELLAMFRQRHRDLQSLPLPWVVFGGVLVTVLAAGAPAFVPVVWHTGAVGQLGWLAIGLAAALLVACVAEIVRYDSPGQATSNLALAALAIIYVGGLMGFLIQLRLLGDSRGMLALASLIATVKMSDTGQYFVGRKFGRRKLAPRVSPGKTWEGVAGGALFAIVGAALVFSSAGASLHFVAVVVYPLALAAAGIVGDLTESLLKRDAGVKDSSAWLPGFGGVLDLLDSLFGAAPVGYVFWALGWVG
jgi:phosphatidate cytidylyltransferase